MSSLSSRLVVHVLEPEDDGHRRRGDDGQLGDDGIDERS